MVARQVFQKDEQEMVREYMSVLDTDGFVVDTNSWSEDLARKMALDEFKIQLTETHWVCIWIVRNYYQKWGSMPMVKTVREGGKLSVEEFDELFRRGTSSARGVLCKVSGLPKLLCIAAGC
jgi:tRNA 2-thiouridine synthesizing protein E